MEKKKAAAFSWKNPGIQKQAEYLEDFSEWMSEDLRDALEDQYGTLPEALEEVIHSV